MRIIAHKPTYESWHRMKQRCLNPNSPDYKYYGERGITIDSAWMRFDGFFADMGECPIGLTLERIDNDGNYCKSNCKWATRTEQQHNRRGSKLTRTMVNEIHTLYATRKYGYIKLAKKFGVTASHIKRVVLGIHWK
jgi:hypothetical protein